MLLFFSLLMDSSRKNGRLRAAAGSLLPAGDFCGLATRTSETPSSHFRRTLSLGIMPGTRPPFQGDSLGDVFPGLFCLRPSGDSGFRRPGEVGYADTSLPPQTTMFLNRLSYIYAVRNCRCRLLNSKTRNSNVKPLMMQELNRNILNICPK
jgi:hypothetical protein